MKTNEFRASALAAASSAPEGGSAAAARRACRRAWTNSAGFAVEPPATKRPLWSTWPVFVFFKQEKRKRKRAVR